METLEKKHIGNRYFMYERFKRGASLMGKGFIDITCGEFDFWAVEYKGYKTKGAAKKLLNKELAANEFHPQERKVVGYRLFEYCDEKGYAQKWRMELIEEA